MRTFSSLSNPVQLYKVTNCTIMEDRTVLSLTTMGLEPGCYRVFQGSTQNIGDLKKRTGFKR